MLRLGNPTMFANVLDYEGLRERVGEYYQH